jgi:hypothetical protein
MENAFEVGSHRLDGDHGRGLKLIQQRPGLGQGVFLFQGEGAYQGGGIKSVELGYLAVTTGRDT